MPYSLDPDENKLNATSPSEYLTVNEQLMYKLAALDAAVQGGFRRLDEKMDRFQKDLHEGQIKTNDRISDLDKETSTALTANRDWIERLIAENNVYKSATDRRFVELETWRSVVVAKIGMLVTGIVTVWTLLAPSVRDFLGISNT